MERTRARSLNLPPVPEHSVIFEDEVDPVLAPLPAVVAATVIEDVSGDADYSVFPASVVASTPSTCSSTPLLPCDPPLSDAAIPVLPAPPTMPTALPSSLSSQPLASEEQVVYASSSPYIEPLELLAGAEDDFEEDTRPPRSRLSRLWRFLTCRRDLPSHREERQPLNSTLSMSAAYRRNGGTPTPNEQFERVEQFQTLTSTTATDALEWLKQHHWNVNHATVVFFEMSSEFAHATQNPPRPTAGAASSSSSSSGASAEDAVNGLSSAVDRVIEVTGVDRQTAFEGLRDCDFDVAKAVTAILQTQDYNHKANDVDVVTAALCLTAGGGGSRSEPERVDDDHDHDHDHDHDARVYVATHVDGSTEGEDEVAMPARSVTRRGHERRDEGGNVSSGCAGWQEEAEDEGREDQPLMSADWNVRDWLQSIDLAHHDLESRGITSREAAAALTKDAVASWGLTIGARRKLLVAVEKLRGVQDHKCP